MEIDDRTGYERCYVAFIDILGFSELVDRSERDPEVFDHLLRVLARTSAEHTYRGPIILGASDPYRRSLQLRNLRASAFSDSIVISASADRGSGMLRFFHKVSEVCLALIRMGVLTRGGIAVGNIFQNESVVFGPAMIEAYVLESRVARVPRIVVSPEFVEHFTADYPAFFQQLLGPSLEYLVRDEDGKVYLDYLSQDPAGFEETKDGPGRAAMLADVRELLRKRVLEVSASPPDVAERLWPKYEWYTRYFNRVVEGAEGCGVPVLLVAGTR